MYSRINKSDLFFRSKSTSRAAMHQLEFHPQVVLAERPPVPLTIPRHIQKKQYAPNRFFVIQEISFFLFYSMELLWRMQKKVAALDSLVQQQARLLCTQPTIYELFFSCTLL